MNFNSYFIYITTFNITTFNNINNFYCIQNFKFQIYYKTFQPARLTYQMNK